MVSGNDNDVAEAMGTVRKVFNHIRKRFLNGGVGDELDVCKCRSWHCVWS